MSFNCGDKIIRVKLIPPMGFNEWDLLTLREGLFKIRFDKMILSEEEFKILDNKIKIELEKL